METPFSPLPDLPNEVLDLIFSFIPIRARLFVLARLSKEWRRSIYDSVLELPLDRFFEEHFDRKLLCFPRLASLSPMGRWPPKSILLGLASCVRSLHCKLNVSGLERSLAFSSLTSLDIEGFRNHALDLITQNALTLTRLVGRRIGDAGNLALPKLQSLTLLPVTVSLAPFLASHFSSLTSLSLRTLSTTLSNLELISTAEAPCLQEVALDFETLPESLGTWITALPSLTSLSLISHYVNRNVWTLLRHTTCVVRLLIAVAPHEATALADAITPHTRLTQLGFGGFGAPPEGIEAALLPLSFRLKSLCDIEWRPGDMMPMIRQCSNLTAVDIGGAKDLAQLDGCQLPLLEELTIGLRWKIQSPTAVEAFDAARRLLLHCPRIRRFKITLSDDFEGAELVDAAAALEQLLRAIGTRQVKLHLLVPRAQPLAKFSCRYPWVELYVTELLTAKQ